MCRASQPLHAFATSRNSLPHGAHMADSATTGPMVCSIVPMLNQSTSSTQPSSSGCPKQATAPCPIAQLSTQPNLPLVLPAGWRVLCAGPNPMGLGPPCLLLPRTSLPAAASSLPAGSSLLPACCCLPPPCLLLPSSSLPATASLCRLFSGMRMHSMAVFGSCTKGSGRRTAHAILNYYFPMPQRSAAN